MKPNISPGLIDLLNRNERIAEVHFDENGDYHLNAYPEEKVVTNPTNGKILVNAFGQAIKKPTGKTVAGGGHKYIVDSLTRDEVLHLSNNSVAVDDSEKKPEEKKSANQPG